MIKQQHWQQFRLLAGVDCHAATAKATHHLGLKEATWLKYADERLVKMIPQQLLFFLNALFSRWSGRGDLNARPPAPKA